MEPHGDGRDAAGVNSSLTFAPEGPALRKPQMMGLGSDVAADQAGLHGHIIGAGAVRYPFTVTDFYRLPFASLPAHPSTASLAEVTRSSTSLTTNLA